MKSPCATRVCHRDVGRSSGLISAPQWNNLGTGRATVDDRRQRVRPPIQGLALFAFAIVQVVVDLADITRRVIQHSIPVLLGDAELCQPRRYRAAEVMRRRPVDLPRPARRRIEARNEARHRNGEHMPGNERPLWDLRQSSGPVRGSP
jgi:hypothetical protein